MIRDFFLLSALLWVTVLAQQPIWPMAGGNPSALFQSNYVPRDFAVSNISWTFDSFGSIKTSPVIDNYGNIYFTSEIGTQQWAIFSVSSKGSKNWAWNYGQLSAPVISSGTLFIVSWSNLDLDSSALFALQYNQTAQLYSLIKISINSGQILSSYMFSDTGSYPSPSSSSSILAPVVDGRGQVYVAGMGSFLWALTESSPIRQVWNATCFNGWDTYSRPIFPQNLPNQMIMPCNAYSPSSGSTGYIVRDTRNGTVIFPSNYVCGTCSSPSSTSFAMGASDKTVMIWSGNTFQVVNTLTQTQLPWQLQPVGASSLTITGTPFLTSPTTAILLLSGGGQGPTTLAQQTAAYHVDLTSGIWTVSNYWPSAAANSQFLALGNGYALTVTLNGTTNMASLMLTSSFGNMTTFLYQFSSATAPPFAFNPNNGVMYFGSSSDGLLYAISLEGSIPYNWMPVFTVGIAVVLIVMSWVVGCCCRNYAASRQLKN